MHCPPVLRVGLCWLALLLICSSARAQNTDWIQRLDRDGDGYIDPDEMSARVRQFLQRFADSSSRIDLSSRVSVRRLEWAVRRYYEGRDSGRRDESAPVARAGSIPGFELPANQTLIPGFGGAAIRYPYTKEDLEQADRRLDRYDRDGDGYLDADEIARARWSDPGPEAFDFDGDGRLSRIELAQRYARRRIDERDAALPLATASSQPEATETVDTGPLSGRTQSRSRSRERSSRYLAYALLERYDFNKDGVLDTRELAAAGIESGKADFDRDGVVDRSELTEYIYQEMEKKGNDMSELLPTWFFERDLDGDGQVDMAEFADQWDEQTAEEFAAYDLNGDGVITADELLASTAIAGGRFANQSAEVLLPRSIVVSEIQVDEDVIIDQLRVELSITHTYVSHLDGYLIGPDGLRIELFSRVGGSDDHFDRTVFSDDASTRISRGKPPYRGEFRPSAVDKRQKSLSEYQGTNLKGIWQLVIRSSRSDRAGVLNHWSLVVKADQQSTDRLASDRATAPSSQ